MGLGVQPVFDAQARDLLEIAEVGREQEGVIGQGDGGDFQILSADADPLLAEGDEDIGGCLFPIDDGPVTQEVNQLCQPQVGAICL